MGDGFRDVMMVLHGYSRIISLAYNVETGPGDDYRIRNRNSHKENNRGPTPYKIRIIVRRHGFFIESKHRTHFARRRESELLKKARQTVWTFCSWAISCGTYVSFPGYPRSNISDGPKRQSCLEEELSTIRCSSNHSQPPSS